MIITEIREKEASASFSFVQKNRLCIIFFHTNIMEKGNEKNELGI